jgi:hypothetical protein
MNSYNKKHTLLKPQNNQINKKTTYRDMTDKERKVFFNSAEVQEAISGGVRGIQRYNATHKKTKIYYNWLGYEINGKKFYHLGTANNNKGTNLKIFNSAKDAQDAGYVLDTK